ncbi:hypothetical protein DL765_009377 [Monosporascus sp. GIB2]|nr:hypothetical protein DL765_009377 [Monosporascus sp. GIB2]
MTGMMPYHYPQASRDGDDVGMHAEYMSGYDQPTTSSVEVRPAHQLPPTQPPLQLSPASLLPVQETTAPSVQGRDPPSTTSKLRRSTSTPNVRPQGTHDADAGSFGLSGEKKRNKLGYHRSAMACGRKRKIRCLQDPTDAQGRCVTCIRLRKDCSYRPVDHPAQGTPTHTGGSSAFHVEESVASPSAISGRPLQARGTQHHEQMATGGNLGQASAQRGGDDPYSANQGISSSVPGYGHGIADWAGSQTAAVTSPSSVEMHVGVSSDSAWRHYPHESSVTPGFPPFATHRPQTSSGWPPAPVGIPTGNEPASGSEDGWSSFPQPMRSLSYGGETTGQYLPDRLPYDRRASTTSDMYPPQITAGTATMAGTAMDPHAPLSAGAVPPATYATWPHPYQYTQSDDEYDDWYGETGGEPSHGGDVYYQGR